MCKCVNENDAQIQRIQIFCDASQMQERSTFDLGVVELEKKEICLTALCSKKHCLCKHNNGETVFVWKA